LHQFARNHKLRPEVKRIFRWPVCAKKLSVKSHQIQPFVRFIFGPLPKKLPVGCVGVDDVPQPLERSIGQITRRKSPQAVVKIVGVVERFSLAKNSVVGEGIVSVNEVVKVGMGFAPDVG